MSRTGIVIKRNVRLFFRDKGMFFTSLITPAILLVLYATFLAGVYRDSFTAALPPALQLPEDQLYLLLEKREEILTRLKKYYKSIVLDLEVRK